jgi:hypothetical protein
VSQGQSFETHLRTLQNTKEQHQLEVKKYLENQLQVFQQDVRRVLEQRLKHILETKMDETMWFEFRKTLVDINHQDVQQNYSAIQSLSNETTSCVYKMSSTIESLGKELRQELDKQKFYSDILAVSVGFLSIAFIWAGCSKYFS